MRCPDSSRLGIPVVCLHDCCSGLLRAKIEQNKRELIDPPDIRAIRESEFQVKNAIRLLDEFLIERHRERCVFCRMILTHLFLSYVIRILLALLYIRIYNVTAKRRSAVRRYEYIREIFFFCVFIRAGRRRIGQMIRIEAKKMRQYIFYRMIRLFSIGRIHLDMMNIYHEIPTLFEAFVFSNVYRRNDVILWWLIILEYTYLG